MMYQQVIARRYAKGLLLAADEKEMGTIEKSFGDLVAMVEDSGTPLTRLFEDPAFSPLDRKAVLKRFAEKLEWPKTLHLFFLLLVDKDRMKIISLIHEAFISLLDEKKKRLRVFVKSASAVDTTQLNEISELLKETSNKEVLLSTKIDPDLLGGIRLEMEGRVFDASIRAKLDSMKEALLHNIGH